MNFSLTEIICKTETKIYEIETVRPFSKLKLLNIRSKSLHELDYTGLKLLLMKLF